MGNYTNSQIITLAKQGKSGTTRTGNMRTDAYRAGFKRYGAPYTGYLSPRLAAILNERFRAGAISQVIYSYGTPIAWLDAGAWIVPSVRYSITTSTKHQSQLYRLAAQIKIPHDESLSGYMGLLNGTKRPYSWQELHSVYR